MIGNGVVVDPRVLTEEIDELRRRGIDISGLRISANAHLIMPYHLLLDQAGEARLGKLQIGTTKRGIGPCYADKAARLGIRVQDLLDEKILEQKIYAALEPKRQLLRPFAKDPQLDLHTMTEEYRAFGHRLEPYIADTPPIAWKALDSDRLVVFEGAQGTLLDIDHGTYPFVTSSNPVAGAACVGAGVGPKSIDEVWGVAKAYCTRVGAGPVPDRARRRARRAHPRGRRRVRHHHRPRAAHRLARPGRAALRRARERPHGARDHEARRAHRHRPAARGRRATSGPEGATLRRVPLPPVGPAQGERRLVELPGWHEDITGARSLDDLPRQRAGLPRLHRATSSASRS